MRDVLLHFVKTIRELGVGLCELRKPGNGKVIYEIILSNELWMYEELCYIIAS